MKINGEEKQQYIGMNVTEMLVGEQYPLTRVAVELNGMILPKTLFQQTVLQLDDVVEVVCFVGGG